MFWVKSLKSRFFINVSMILILFSAASVFWSYSFSRQVAIERLLERANALVDEVQYAFEILNQFYDEFSVRRLVEQLATLTGVHEVGLTDRDGRFTIQSLLQKEGTIETSPLVKQAVSSEERKWGMVDNRYMVVQPLHGRTYLPEFKSDIVGTIVVSTNIAAEEKKLQRSLLPGTFFSLAMIILLGLMGSLIVNNMVLDPISLLSDATKKIAQGDWQTRVQSNRQDEIGELARSFNAMAESLESREKVLASQREELQKAHNGLEIRVKERTEELAQVNEKLQFELAERLRHEEEKKKLEAQLLHAQKMEAVGILAGGIAHDFNNILQIISGYTHVLLNKIEPTSPLIGYVKNVANATSRAAALTQQLLIFGRKMESQLQRVELNQVLEYAVNLLKGTLPKMIRIELKLAPELWTIEADAMQLEQLLMNLAVNARDAMPEGGRLILETGNVSLGEEYINSHLEAIPGEYVWLAVSDTGTGIDKESMQHIFEPFFTTKGVGKGTGLGLAIVYGIVKNHNGYIMCYSEPGQGTQFKIYFPASKKAVEIAETPTSEKPQTARGRETILIVDDEPLLIALGEEILKDSGYVVVSAESGEMALEVFRREKIDLVILDLNMPGMGGYKCLKALRALDPQSKVIVASGFSAEVTMQETLKSEANGYIRKPFQWEDMIARVREVLDGGSGC